MPLEGPKHEQNCNALSKQLAVGSEGHHNNPARNTAVLRAGFLFNSCQTTRRFYFFCFLAALFLTTGLAAVLAGSSVLGLSMPTSSTSKIRAE